MSNKLGVRMQEIKEKQRNKKMWNRVVSLLMAVTILATTYFVIIPAITLDNYDCGIEEHIHSEKNGCYTENKTLVCKEKEGGHKHAEACYEEKSEQVCKLEESEEHTHSEKCKDEEGKIICEKEESKGHKHTAECKKTEKVLVCKEEETAEIHKHTDKCYEVEQELTCKLTEHEHTDKCKAKVPEKAEGEEESFVVFDHYYSNINTSAVKTADLLIQTDNPNVFTKNTNIVSKYDDVYIVSCNSIQEARYVYSYYVGKVNNITDLSYEYTTAEPGDAKDVPDLSDLNNGTDSIAKLNDMGGRNLKGYIALIDTGASADINYSVINGSTADSNGHGTKMLRYIKEENPNAKVVSIKAFNGSKATAADVYAGIKLAIKLKVSVINLSFVSSNIEKNAIVKDVINEALASGIKVVGAAGNYNTNARAFIPACVKGVTAVGAVNPDGTKQAKSNYNADLYVVADSTSEATARYSAILLSGKTSDKVFKTLKEATNTPKPPENTGDQGANEGETPQTPGGDVNTPSNPTEFTVQAPTYSTRDLGEVDADIPKSGSGTDTGTVDYTLTGYGVGKINVASMTGDSVLKKCLQEKGITELEVECSGHFGDNDATDSWKARALQSGNKQFQATWYASTDGNGRTSINWHILLSDDGKFSVGWNTVIKQYRWNYRVEKTKYQPPPATPLTPWIDGVHGVAYIDNVKVWDYYYPEDFNNIFNGFISEAMQTIKDQIPAQGNYDGIRDFQEWGYPTTDGIDFNSSIVIDRGIVTHTWKEADHRQIFTRKVTASKKPSGSLKLKKTSNDGVVAGFRFRITGNGFDKTLTTDAGGNIDETGLTPGEYTVEELPDPKYLPQPPQKVTIRLNEVSTVTFNNTRYETLKIKKTSEDGVIDGVGFNISGNGINKDVITNAQGECSLPNLLPGIYVVKEYPDAQGRYIPQDPKTIKVDFGEPNSVSFENKLKRGNLKIIKISENKPLPNMRFHLYGTSLSGAKVDEYATTNANGIAEFKDILISAPGKPYTVEEVGTPIQFVVPVPQKEVIEWMKDKTLEFDNKPKKFVLKVIKHDDGTGATPQGDATLEGAVFGIYKGGVLVDQYTTDAKGEFTTKEYKCDIDWTCREITPPKGYKLDSTVHPIGADPKLYEIEVNYLSEIYKDKVMKNSIAIYKHWGNGTSGVEFTEEGAQFEVYLKAAGSYAKAKPTERDLITTDKNGYAKTKELPYGVYVVHQIKGKPGKELADDFDVVISEDSDTKDPYTYIVDNNNFKSYVKVVKVDSETGKVIPYAGAAFKIKDPDGKLISMQYTYPQPTTIDVFYTNKNGYLVTPEELPYGTGYTLIEVKAPFGYVLDPTPVKFDITEKNQTQEDAVKVVKVEKKNTAQKGKITVTKTGEVFSSVSVVDGLYQPIYSTSGFAGAVYEVTAAEDISTPDGTLRYEKGKVVATITTGADGTGTSGELYLGKYIITEKKAPHGLIINGTPQTITINYAGETVKVVAVSAKFDNERQRVKINLNKVMEQDEKFKIGMNGEILSVKFALYAAEELKATDGKVIPKDGLIEIISCNEKGEATFKTDLPVGAKLYIKEHSTDEHYIISDEIHPVEFTYAGQDIKVVDISANKDGKPFENEAKRGKVVGLKVDPEGNIISGALFGLFKPDETEFTEETAILTAVSDENGKFVFENIPYGNWAIRELKPTEGFALNKTVYPVTISEHEETVEIKVENKRAFGNVETTKVDVEYPDNKLTGAVFEIYKDVDGDKKYDPKNDELVEEMAEVETGIYRLEKLQYGGYFLYEKTAPKGFLKDDNYHYFEIKNDGETVNVENEAGVGFINKPEYGELELTKRDIADGRLLPNAGFRIKNEKGETIVDGYTDGNGIAKFKLRVGKYTYEEFDAPEGYLIDTSPYPFEIKENNEIVKAEMHNVKEPIPEKPDIWMPKTGDISGMGLWLALGVIGVCGIIICCVVYAKKKKNCDN